MNSSPRFVLVSRADCGLCDEMLAELTALTEMQGWPIDILDIDSDGAARSRYGHKIPVLLFAGEIVCHGRLDAREVHKALALHR